MDVLINRDLTLQEPDVSTADQLSELILENLPTPTNVQSTENLLDAMDKIVDHEDISFSEPRHWLNFRDCMDVITSRISDLVDVVNLENLAKWDTVKTTPCRVELVRIDYTPTVKLPTL